ncbi:medium chain dehydrogenase/reductase family protein [Halobacteriovorax sp. GB3]|uniref:synaptic vesicle VAT-1 family membrane protein n=1 Tax=Halobacteriovorax sp. GB3 TaxID=2719615 RepID=UPI002360B1F4|nr:medium chain dehydrogenase/reductase family protein [Halobacteriovorax sp. GB3]MDD0853572.1 medium chain dehydrogenase/reductase family protein [Halobacteriovorax sp. GB3]
MRKIQISGPGGYEKLEIVDFEIESPKDNEVQIEVRAIGVNYADVCIRWGLYESAKQFIGWPITPGFEWSGIVKEVGSSRNSFKVGDEVFGVSFFGGYTSHLNVPIHQVFKKPQNLSFEQAAAVPTVFLTAYFALFQNMILRENSKIIVHSAAGGVGSCLVQLANLKNIEVLGIVGSSHKVDYVKSLGAKSVIDKSKEDWFEVSRNFSPKGFDAVFDANGYTTLKKSFDLLAPMGKLVSYGFHSMLPKKGGRVNWFKAIYAYLRTPRFNPLDMTNQNKSLLTFNLSFLFDQVDILKESMEEIIRLLEAEQISPPRVATYSLEEVGSAHRDLESAKTVGKLILLP